MPSATDNELLNFDHKRLATFDAKAARRALRDQREAFEPQLVTAHFLDGWRERMVRPSIIEHHSPEWYEGFDYAMREVAAHLRQGDFLPGGILHDEQASGKFDRD